MPRSHVPPVIRSLGRVFRDASRSRRYEIKFVVGDGIQPVQSLLSPLRIRDELTTRLGRPPTPGEESRERWKYYEYARFHTFNSSPGFAYFLLVHLANAGLVTSITTTNYDSYLDSLSLRIEPWNINPCARKGDYCWEDYYSQNAVGLRRAWKIHGSLSHVLFHGCSDPVRPHIFRLPHFPVYNSVGAMRRSFNFSANHDHLSYIGMRHGIPSLNYERQKAGDAHHFLDWELGDRRKAFKTEIEASIDDLLSSSTRAIVMIGFTGYYDNRKPDDPFNEELVPHVIALSKRVPVFYLIRQSQALRLRRDPPPTGSLYHYFRRRLPNRFAVFSEAGTFLAACLEHAHLASSSELRARYSWDWEHGDMFIPRDHFPKVA
jgi:hypothetical protein